MPPKRKKNALPAAPDDLTPPLPPARPLPIIKVIGISGAGKSTLVHNLRTAGYDARPVSQEHSNVPNLWQQFDRPAYLIYLYASLEDQEERRQDVSWSPAAHQEELRRLAHGREHADLRIDTGKLTRDTVFNLVRSFLIQQRVRHASHPLPALPATGSAFKPPSASAS